MYKFEKFPEDLRTFTTRLKFISEMFNALHPQTQILAQCIEHKLGRSLENYERELSSIVWNLKAQDSNKVLNKLRKGV